MPKSARKPNLADLPRREREVMEVLIRTAGATAAEILGELDDPPTNSAIRGTLRHLAEKGFVVHEWSGPQYVWKPVPGVSAARKPALSHVIKTFFNNSRVLALEAMLGSDANDLTDADLDRMAEVIASARATKKKRAR